MQIVVDTNRIIAALLKDGASRKILFTPEHSFITPDYAREEIEKHADFLMRKTSLNRREFNIIIDMLFAKIHLVNLEQYKTRIGLALQKLSDKNDAPFLALALENPGSVIWSDDKVFKHQRFVSVFTTSEMLEHSSYGPRE